MLKHGEVMKMFGKMNVKVRVVVEVVHVDDSKAGKAPLMERMWREQKETEFVVEDVKNRFDFFEKVKAKLNEEFDNWEFAAVFVGNERVGTVVSGGL